MNNNSNGFVRISMFIFKLFLKTRNLTPLDTRNILFHNTASVSVYDVLVETPSKNTSVN